MPNFEQVFWIHNHQFAYIDPPYFGNEGEYGGSRKNGFNHEKLRELVDGRKKTAISYNDHPKAYELYDGHYIQSDRRGTRIANPITLIEHTTATQTAVFILGIV